MIVVFKTKELEKLYSTPLNQIKGKQKYSKNVIKQYQVKVKILTIVENLKELRSFRSLNFEALRGERIGRYSIRLNKQFRLIFDELENQKIQLEIIEISKHYE